MACDDGWWVKPRDTVGETPKLRWMKPRGRRPRNLLQRAALKEAGCKRTFEEKVSGAKRDRPELARMIEPLRDDDTVVVTRLDRLARSTRNLLDIAEKLKEAGAGLRSLAEP